MMTARETHLAQATAVADHLVRTAIGNRERITWVHTPEAAVSPQAGRLQGVTAGPAFYEGLAGIAHFLLDAGVHLDRPDHREAARRAIRQALWQLHDRSRLRPTGEALPSPSSFYGGEVGVLWVAWNVGRATGDAWLLGAASDLVARLRRRTLKGDRLDLVSGLSGSVRPLLQLETQGLAGAGALARRYADHLVHAARWDGPRATWSPDLAASAPLTGFSHGAAGIALALASAHAATGDPRHADAARGAMAYEDAVFDPARENWPDYRESAAKAAGPTHFAVGWCHGAPGIGLSRALVLPALRSIEGRAAVEAAARTTARALAEAVDDPDTPFQLCHGAFGTAQTLEAMDAALGRPREHDELHTRLAEAALARHADSMEGWPDASFLGWNTGLPGLVNVSLMTGLAGVGHHFLRLGSHDPVESVLAPGGFTADTIRKAWASLE